VTGSPAEHLSDQMPAVARGLSAWSPGDEAHLAGCPDCRAEWRLHTMAQSLGRAVDASLDVNAVVAGVATRLRGAERRTDLPSLRGAKRRSNLRWLVPLAAAAALLVAVLPRIGDPGAGTAGTTVAQTWLPELEVLSADELESLFEVLPAAEGEDGGVTLPSPRLGDLTADELELLLRSLEG